MKLCKYCAHEIASSKNICPYCGNPQTKEETDTSFVASEKEVMRGPYRKWITVVLCLVLGFLGAHKFYEEKYWMGILYIFTHGFFGVGIILDFIVLLFRPKYYYLPNISMVSF